MVEKTGYPKDMLDLELDLEADLGVDTVKQAEMFAAIREIYNIPRDENRKLRDYPTLAHVIRFVFENRPDLAGRTFAPPVSDSRGIRAGTSSAATLKLSRTTPSREKVLEIVAEKTGYPKDMLDLDLDLEADLGVDTVKQAEMFAAVRAAYNIPRDENLKLRDFPTLAHVIQFARDRASLAASTPDSKNRNQQPGSEVPASPAAASLPMFPRPALASLDAANRIPRRVPVPDLAPAPYHLQANRSEARPRRPCGRHARPRWRCRCADSSICRTQGVEACASRHARCRRPYRAPQDLDDSGPVQGVYWLPALDNEGHLSRWIWRPGTKLCGCE